MLGPLAPCLVRCILPQLLLAHTSHCSLGSLVPSVFTLRTFAMSTGPSCVGRQVEMHTVSLAFALVLVTTLLTYLVTFGALSNVVAEQVEMRTVSLVLALVLVTMLLTYLVNLGTLFSVVAEQVEMLIVSFAGALVLMTTPLTYVANFGAFFNMWLRRSSCSLFASPSPSSS